MRIPGARAIRLPDRRGTKQRDSWRSPRKKSGNADPEGDEVPAWDECADEWMTLAGTMNEAGIDCDAGQGPDSIRRWNACMPDQFPVSGGWAQERGGDAMFKRLESGGLVHGACWWTAAALRDGERAARRENVPDRTPVRPECETTDARQIFCISAAKRET